MFVLVYEVEVTFRAGELRVLLGSEAGLAGEKGTADAVQKCSHVGEVYHCADACEDLDDNKYLGTKDRDFAVDLVHPFFNYSLLLLVRRGQAFSTASIALPKWYQLDCPLRFLVVGSNDFQLLTIAIRPWADIFTRFLMWPSQGFLRDRS